MPDDGNFHHFLQEIFPRCKVPGVASGEQLNNVTNTEALVIAAYAGSNGYWNASRTSDYVWGRHPVRRCIIKEVLLLTRAS